ncbi:hypothetical protein H7R52_05515 [Weissella confusa]|uniref:Uncharacterized protein n=1 Tax=Weissella confusa TaxID=1583 RepID=A0A923SMT7_WEICO|nr:hypothetical protein [Weissella confusa]
MNWIPEMMKRAAKYGGDLDHPEVVAWAHEQWQKAANAELRKCKTIRLTNKKSCDICVNSGTFGLIPALMS